MVAPRTKLRHLKNYTNYLNNFPPHQRSVCFEKLASESYATILNLPFFSSDNDNPNLKYRVTWLGSDSAHVGAPSGRSDAIACAYGFHILIEPTLKTGSNQWSQEFAACVRHGEAYVAQEGISPDEVYVNLVAPVLHIDTLRSIRRGPRSPIKVIPIEVSMLTTILETSTLAFTMRHLELRHLFNKIWDCVESSSSVSDFQKSSGDEILKWQKEVLRIEKGVFIGFKSYEAMKRIGRKYIGTSEILYRLQKHPYVTHYLKIIGDMILPDYIQESLTQQSFASQIGKTLDGEGLFCPVLNVDFRGRQERLIKAVMEGH